MKYFNWIFSNKSLSIILLALAFLLPFSGTAQDMEGSIRYLVTHNWSKKMGALDYISKQRRERIEYMNGNRSEWKVYTNLFFNATETKYEDSEEKAEPDDEGYSWRKEVFFVKRNFEKNTVYEAEQVSGKTYIIEDSLYTQPWKVMNDIKEVAGHVCMNASWEDTVKMEKIVVWFALDMPLSAGPERLCGLPGLILEADYNDGAMLITADKIEMKKLGTELDIPKKLKGKKVKEAEFTALITAQIAEKRKDEQPWFWNMRY